MSFGGDYRPGQPYGICDRCGFKLRLYAMKTEWTGLKVCDKCLDPKPPDTRQPYINPREGGPIPNARPDVIEEVADEALSFTVDGITYTPD